MLLLYKHIFKNQNLEVSPKFDTHELIQPSPTICLSLYNHLCVHHSYGNGEITPSHRESCRLERTFFTVKLASVYNGFFPLDTCDSGKVHLIIYLLLSNILISCGAHYSYKISLERAPCLQIPLLHPSLQGMALISLPFHILVQGYWFTLTSHSFLYVK